MQYWEIAYYRSYNWVDKKYVSSELGSTDAIRKTKLKSIIDVTEITKEQFKEYKQKQKEYADRRKARLKELKDGFIQY